MKSILLLLLIICFTFSCKEQTIGPNPLDPINPTPTTLQDLHLSGSKALVPTNLLSENNIAVFINSNGEEKRLEFEFNSGMKTSIYKGIKYNAEFIEIDYIDPSDPIYEIDINAAIRYSTYTVITEVVTASIVTTVNSNFISTVMLGANGDALMSKFLPEITVANLTFTNVYTDMAPNSLGYDSYSQTYYSPQQGVVAFQGQNGMMWALKEYKQE